MKGELRPQWRFWHDARIPPGSKSPLPALASALTMAILLGGVAHAQPAAPANLVAAPGDSQATLTWQDPEDDDITGYELRRAGSAENLGAWAAIAGSGAGTAEHVASGLANGQRHYFELRAVSDAGAGPAAAASIALAATPDAVVDIPDALLRAAFAQWLGKEAGAPITQGEMATVDELFAEGWEDAQIADLAGIEFAVNLEYLNLLGNDISDVTALAGLTALTELDLADNRISNVAALGGLTSLEYLYLWDNNISDTSALADLTALVELELSGNDISDVSALASLTALEGLYLGANNLSDISALSGFAGLRSLGLYRNSISDVSPLSGLTALTRLDLDYNRVSDVSALSGLTALTTLELRDNRVSDIVPLANLTALTRLVLRNNRVAEVSALSGLNALTRLDLHRNRIADLSPLADLTALRWLFLSSNNVADLSALKGLTALGWLYLTGNSISDIGSLSGLTDLRFLYLDRNSIADISALANLTTLVDLSLDGNAIQDIGALAELTALRKLTLSQNGISDISPLAGLAGLAELRLRDNRIADISALSGLARLRLLNLYGNNVSDLSALAGLAALTELDLPDNRIADVSELAGLTELRSLYLSGNSISDVSPLSGLAELEVLYLDDNGISDISALAGELEKLRYADLRGNPLDGDAKATHVAALRGTQAVVVYDDGAHRVPLFPRMSSDGMSPEGFVRIINHSNAAGEVAIEAVDEMGGRRGPVTLAIGAGAALHLTAADLEAGNAGEGLTGGVGEGVGDWRLTLRSDLDIEVLGYARAADGFVASLHDLAPEAWTRQDLWTFNPGSNESQVSRLRLINPTEQSQMVEVYGIDDDGVTGSTTIAVPAGRTVSYTARQLESGEADGLVGGLGDGKGKWWLGLFGAGIRVMGLMETPTGHLVNLSTQTGLAVRDPAYDRSVFGGEYRVPLFPAVASPLQGFVRAIAPGNDRPPNLTLTAIDDSGQASRTDTLAAVRGGALHFNSNHLEAGDAAKGLSGTGSGMGSWHLRLRAERRFRVLAYARAPDGFLTSLHDVAPRADDGSLWIPFFNPGNETHQVSRLRLVNWEAAPVAVTITGTDDAGVPGGTVRATVPGGAVWDFTAQQLESGDGPGLAGALGSGTGKWRLRVEAEGELDAMSLLELPTGHLANLSTTPRYPR